MLGLAARINNNMDETFSKFEAVQCLLLHHKQRHPLEPEPRDKQSAIALTPQSERNYSQRLPGKFLMFELASPSIAHVNCVLAQPAGLSTASTQAENERTNNECHGRMPRPSNCGGVTSCRRATFLSMSGMQASLSLPASQYHACIALSIADTQLTAALDFRL